MNHLPPSRLATVEATGQTPLKIKGKNKQNEIESQGIFIATLNTKSLCKERQLIQLQNALNNIKWDILGVSEVRRMGEEIIELQNGDIFSYVGQTKGLYGVGFLINNRWRKNILSFKHFSDRVTVLKMMFNSCKVSIVQVYAPTSAASTSTLENFYKDLDQAITFCKSEVIITIGDFNASLGVRQDGEEDIMGPYGFGIRNERGERLIQWLWQNHFTSCSSLFKKRPNRKWTWMSPNTNLSSRKFEIDYVFCNKPNLVQDVEVVNNFGFDSDHRLVRSKILINHKTRMLHKNKSHLPKIIPEQSKSSFTTNLSQRWSILQHLETNVQEEYDRMEKSIQNAATTHILQSAPKKELKLSRTTQELINQRDALIQNENRSTLENLELRRIREDVKKQTQTDIEEFNKKYVLEIMNQNKSVKKAIEFTKPGKSWIPSMNLGADEVTSRAKINEVATVYYENLFNTRDNQNWQPTTLFEETQIPSFLESEITSAINSLDNEKSGGTDHIKAELLKFGVEVLSKWLTKLFNRILSENQIPKQWTHSDIVLIHKKGAKTDMNNYRPISVISNIYKIFAKCLLRRLKYQLSYSQSDDQAAFKSGFSTSDHLQSINQLIEKSSEYQLPVYLAFVDFKKAFDSVEHHAIWDSLEHYGVSQPYILLLKNIYSKTTASISTERKGRTFKIKRGVKQGDPLSPILFSTVLEKIFDSLNWETKGMNIHGRRLTNLRFADDIVLVSQSHDEMQVMLNELMNECAKVGLLPNKDKTKVMTNCDNTRNLSIQETNLEYVNSYIYLGQVVSFVEPEAEVNRRITNAWKKFWSLKELFNMNLSKDMRKYIFDVSVIPVLIYGCQTWKNSQASLNKIATCQRAMERAILKISLMHRIRSSSIRSQTGFEDAKEKARGLKWDWAGHICRLQDERWTKVLTEWIPYGHKRRVGRQHKRWKDEIHQFCPNYYRTANNRTEWKEIGVHFKLEQGGGFSL